MARVPAHLRRLVITRAHERCEYCRLAQAAQEATFHIDHIVPEFDGGETIAENLALACVSCSLRKEARRTALDFLTGKYVPLYNPRRDIWEAHFAWEGVVLIGKTAKGRATIELLKMNRPRVLRIRREEALWGRHPPRD